MRMRSFRTPLVAGVGAFALAGSLIVPGIAGADPAADVDTATDVGTYTSPGNYSIRAENKGDCTAEFRLTSLRESKANWRADYRVGGEDAHFNLEGENRKAFRPAVASNQGIVDAINKRGDKIYPMGNQIATVDLTADRLVPTGDKAADVKTLPGVTANADGTHVVKFGVYQGPVGVGSEVYEETVDIIVTGCPVTPVDDNGDGDVDETPTPDAGSLDFGSLFGNLSSSDSS